ncbi:hypothetical protein IMCC3317_38940 [Kordia antarctica]|uniref:Uncharacterized protein n=1 Tax=Kordia antarctica TaxID=1218801 RepID=A0A7L4ZPQ3_9FLAO|nr:hypothetical protein [Kordia antarctica]QHI38501.1 hypothetical protein IMCC3317_38940 [Kordia antarctica]
MKKIILIILLSSYGLFAQTIDDLKKSDSIYFYFSSSGSQEKKVSNEDSYTKDTIVSYSYFKNGKEFLGFRYSKYKNFDAIDAKKETYKQYHKKEFLIKNEQQIVDIKFLNKLSLHTFEFRNIIQGKKLFLIDDEEITGEKILIREVFINMLDAAICDDTENIKVTTVKDIPPFYYEMRSKDEFYTFLKPKKDDGNENLYVLFKPSNNTYKNSYKYTTLNGSIRSESKIQEQFTFKLTIKNQKVFFQLTNKRKQKMILLKKDDLFSGKYNTVSHEKLSTLSEKQFENLFSTVKNIYVVENFENSEFVTLKLVKISAEANDFIRKDYE